MQEFWKNLRVFFREMVDEKAPFENFIPKKKLKRVVKGVSFEEKENAKSAGGD